MSEARPGARFRRFEFFGSARFVHALATATVGSVAASYALQRLLGWPGYIAILATLIVLAAVSMAFRWQALDWRGILPLSLIAFTGWCCVSVFWSSYQWATLAGALYLVTFALLGVFVAITRDIIQIVRIVGDVLRVLLAVSLALETLSGVILNVPIDILGIRGQISYGGPIEGLFGDGAHLGIVALVAVITFAFELVTRSVPTPLSISSIAGAVVLILLSQSGVTLGAATAVVVAALVLTAIRRTRPQYRPPILWALVALGVVALFVIIANLGEIIALFQNSDTLVNRHGLWDGIVFYAQQYPLQGWGWIGRWRSDLQPFAAFQYTMNGTPYASAFNAFLDVAFQVGFVGLAVFCVLVGLVLVRSMHLAVRQQSVVYLWPPLVLVALVGTSLTESTLITEFSWFLLVVCVVKTANKLSWRVAFERVRPRTLPPELPRSR